MDSDPRWIGRLLMGPPPAGPPGQEKAQAEGSLRRAKKLIGDLEKKGLDVSEAKGWYQQSDEMYRGGLYRTSLIYAQYALDVANEMFERIRAMIIKISKVKARAKDMLGANHKDMPNIEKMIGQMKEAINEGRLDDCQDLINTADDIMRGSSSPHLSIQTAGYTTVSPSRGYSACPDCGNIVDASWVECRYCGTNLKENSEGADSGPAWTQTNAGPLRVSADGFMEDMKDPPPVKLPPPLEPVRPKAGIIEETRVDLEMSEDMEDLKKVEDAMSIVEDDLGDEGPVDASDESHSKDKIDLERGGSEENEGPEKAEDPKVAEVGGPDGVTEAVDTPAEEEDEKKGSGFLIPPPPSMGNLGTVKIDNDNALQELKCAQCGEELDPSWIKCPVCKSFLD